MGGGYELANLYPRVTGLPKTLGANPGITVTETTPGTYRFKGGIQATLRPDDGGESITFGPNNYGPKTLPAGRVDTNIFVNTIGDMDALITPRLYKID